MARTPSQADCYSSGERAWMNAWARRRARALDPILSRFARWGVRADHVTLLALLSGLAFCPLLWFGHQLWALIALAAHLALDGLDGPLARSAGTASRRGSFTDTTADQIVVTATTIALIGVGAAGLWAGGVYAFVYGAVVAFAMVRNALAIPYSWLVRPRMVVYGWLPIELYLMPGSLNWVLWICSALLAFKMGTGSGRYGIGCDGEGASRGLRLKVQVSGSESTRSRTSRGENRAG